MLPVCVHVCVSVCVCVCGKEKCVADTQGLQGPWCKSPGLLVQRPAALHITYRERERDQTCKHVLDISTMSICLAEDYPQLSTPVSGRKGGQQAPLTSMIYESID